jgi:hypothetical protein
MKFTFFYLTNSHSLEQGMIADHLVAKMWLPSPSSRNKFPAKSVTKVLGVVVSEQFGAIEVKIH